MGFGRPTFIHTDIFYLGGGWLPSNFGGAFHFHQKVVKVIEHKNDKEARVEITDFDYLQKNINLFFS